MKRCEVKAGDKGTTIHRKPNGAAYLYAVESYWDKEKRQARNRQVCLGRINEETGEIIPSDRKQRTEKRAAVAPDVVASTKVYGPYLLLMKLAKDTGLAAALKKSFPDTHEEILSLAFFVAQKGLALSRCDIWSTNHKHPFEKPIHSQRVSELLQQITENERQHFLSLWLKRLSESELLCYDITSISSYASANEYVRWGHNRDKEKLPQINLAMLFGQQSGMPAFYRRMPGNITDVITLENTIGTLDFLGKTKLHFILDRGFYSETNVDTLLRRRYHFALMVPTGRVWVRNIIDQYYEAITSPDYYRQTGENEVLYMIPHLHQWGGRRCYAHLYYNASRAAEDFDKLNQRLVRCKEELETENPQESNQEFYERFFIVKRTPKRGLSVKYNDTEIQKYRKRYAGFFCILTNVKTDSGELLELYRRKDLVENSFDDLKNSLDMKRLRVHSSAAMDSRLFIQFIALILISKVRAVAALAKQNKEMRLMTVREIMEAMGCIVRITYSGRYGSTISEIAPLQRDIIGAFGLELDT
jgi:transposase